jgi:enterochelin esterase family protein
MGGDEEAWTTLGRASQIVDNLIAQGKAEPMIIVMPNGNVAQEAAPGESSLGFYKPQFRLPHTMDGKYEETFHEIIRLSIPNTALFPKRKAALLQGSPWGDFIPYTFQDTTPIPLITWDSSLLLSCRMKR